MCRTELRCRLKRKKRSHELMYQFMTCRPAADDPAPSFCLQNDGLEFSKLLSTAHLRQQTTPFCAICQTILSFSTGCPLHVITWRGQSVEKPLLKVKLYQKENGKFSPAFFKRRRIPKAEPLAAHRNGRNLTFRAPGANKKKKAGPQTRRG